MELSERRALLPISILTKVKADTLNPEIISEIHSSATPSSRKRLVSFHNLSPHFSTSSNSSSCVDTPRSRGKSLKGAKNPSRFKTLNPFVCDTKPEIPDPEIIKKIIVPPNPEEERIRKILSTPKRTHDDAVFMYGQLKNYEFFNKFKENNTGLHGADSLLYVCQYLGYEKHPAGKVIFQEGDMANGRLYLVFSGDVSVVIKRPDFVTRHNIQKINEESNLLDSSFESLTHSQIRADQMEEKVKFEVKPDPEEKKDDPFLQIFQKRAERQEEEGRKSTAEKHDGNLAFSVFRGARNWAKLISVLRFSSLSGYQQRLLSKTNHHHHHKPGHEKHKKRDSIARHHSPNDRHFAHSPEHNNFQQEASSPREPKTFSHFAHRKNNSHVKSPQTMINPPTTTKTDLNDERRRSSFFQFQQDFFFKKDHETNQGGEDKDDQFKKAATFNVRKETLASSIIFNTGKSEEEIPDHPEDEKMDIDTIIEQYGFVVNKVQKGSFFGEKALYSRQPRSATIITNTECEFLTISQELFDFIKFKFEKLNTKKLNFLMDNFPDIELTKNRAFLENLLYLLGEKTFDLHSPLSLQGMKGNNFYILVDGICNVYKRLSAQEPGVARLREYGDHAGSGRSDGIHVCQIFPGTFIGEEIVYNGNNQYEFTVRAASSQISVMEIDRSKFTVRFPKPVITGLKKIYRSKAERYESISQERVKLKSEVVHIARSVQKKKVTLILKGENGRETLQLPEPKTARLSEKTEETSSKNKERIAAFKELLHSPALSTSARHLESIVTLADLNIPHKPPKTLNQISNDQIPSLSKIKLDFGTEDLSPRLERSPTSKRVSLKILTVRPLQTDPSSPRDPRNLITLQKVPNIQKDLLGTGLLKRVEKSRKRSQRRFTAMVQKSNLSPRETNFQTPASPISADLFGSPKVQNRTKSESLIPIESKFGSIASSFPTTPPKGLFKKGQERKKQPVTSQSQTSFFLRKPKRYPQSKDILDSQDTPYFSHNFTLKTIPKPSLTLIDSCQSERRISTELSTERGYEENEEIKERTKPLFKRKIHRELVSTPREQGKTCMQLKPVSLEADYFSGIVQTEPSVSLAYGFKPERYRKR